MEFCPRQMNSASQKIKRILGITGLSIVMLLMYHCSDKRVSDGKSELFKEINYKKILNRLTDGYLSKLNAKAQTDFDSTALVVSLGLDSMADIEAFRPFWLASISDLRASDSLDFIFYDSLFKLKLAEHRIHRRFPDSISFFKAQISRIENKLDSAKRGLFGNPVLEQFARLSNEKGNVYFLSAELKYKDDQFLELHFGIEELSSDTIVSLTTGNSLAAFMRTAFVRRNALFWTRGFKKSDTIKSNILRKA